MSRTHRPWLPPGRRPGRRGAAVVTTLLAVGAVLAAPAPRAAAWSDGPCPTLSTGVTVVVDFHQLGGGVVVRCAPGAPADGWEALTGAGFAVRGTTRFPGFVCRIDDRPATDPCVTAAPADAYWSYWNAARGGTWTYSEVGARSRTPPVGSVEAWSFSDETGRPPRIPPPGRPSPATTAPAPRPQPVPAPVPAAPPAGPAAPAGPTPPAAATVPGEAVGRPDRSGPADVAATDPAAPPPPTVEGTTADAAAPPAPDDPDGGDGPAGPRPLARTARGEETSASVLSEPGAGGGPVGTLWGAGLLTALTVSTLVTLRRRRHRPEAPGA